MKKISLILIGIIVVGILYISNHNLVLFFNNVKVSDYKVLYQYINDDNQRSQIITSVDNDDNIVLVNAIKNRFGLWKIVDINKESSENGFVSIAWIEDIGIRRFSVQDKPYFNEKWNFLYYGTNAAKLIEIPSDNLPNNSIISVEQAGTNYMIHITICDEDSEINQFDVLGYLKENNYIAIP